MSGLGHFLLVPAAERAPARPRALAVPALERGAGVLAAASEARVAGALAGAALARRAAPRCALVCVFDAGAAAAVAWPAGRGARRLATALAARGHAVVASGRVVTVTLAGEAETAAAEARRAIAAAGDAAVVLALGGPRDRAFDGLLAERDLVLVAPRDGDDAGALAALAIAGVEALGVPAAGCVLPRSPLTRRLAAAGILSPPPLRAALGAATARPA